MNPQRLTDCLWRKFEYLFTVNRNLANRAPLVFDNLHVSKLYIHNLPHQNSMLDEQMPYYINHLGSNFSDNMWQSHMVHLNKMHCNIIFCQKIKKRLSFFNFSTIFFMFLDNCCLLMASLTPSATSKIILLLLLTLDDFDTFGMSATTVQYRPSENKILFGLKVCMVCNLVYDRNLVSVSATETKIKFRYRFRGQIFFCLNLNFPPF